MRGPGRLSNYRQGLSHWLEKSDIVRLGLSLLNVFRALNTKTKLTSSQPPLVRIRTVALLIETCWPFPVVELYLPLKEPFCHSKDESSSPQALCTVIH